jgi:hypothetical protein
MSELESAESVEAARREASAAGATVHVVTAPKDKAAALSAIAEALEFPDWFGGNLDALHDSLIDLSWLPAGDHVLLWAEPEVLRAADPRGYSGVHSVLADAMTEHRARPGRVRLRVVTVP